MVVQSAKPALVNKNIVTHPSKTSTRADVHECERQCCVWQISLADNSGLIAGRVNLLIARFSSTASFLGSESARVHSVFLFSGLSSDIYDMLSECLQHLDITTDVLHRQKQRKQTVKRKKKTTTTTRQMTPKVYLVKQLQLLESGMFLNNSWVR